MQGPHDMGGKHGFGAINPEQDEPLFHQEWEKRAFALTLAMGYTRQWNIDISRHARENLSYTDYLTLGYYGIWFTALLNLMTDTGLISVEEIDTAKAQKHKNTSIQISPLHHNDVDVVFNKGGSSERPQSTRPLYKLGDTVKTSIDAIAGHTRLPSFAKGKLGIIIAHHNSHVFPDTNAHRQGEQPQHLYTVKISGEELWGNGAEPNTYIQLDLFEPYLAKVEQ